MQGKLSEINYYIPSEDTFFLADYIEKEKGESALDIGTASGYLADILSQNFSLVVATDIDFDSIRSNQYSLSNLVCCKGADVIHNKFDLIVCNLPYLPSDTISDITTDGGKDGVEIPFSILESASHCLKENGKIIFLTSSLANYQKLIDKIKILGFQTKIVEKKKLFFEELILVEARI